ncbi:MAG: hypothetical protein Q8L84_07780 [Hyphomonas sp.]|nr:hypothetical protein [Hyphomonas sp.]
MPSALLTPPAFGIILTSKSSHRDEDTDGGYITWPTHKFSTLQR